MRRFTSISTDSFPKEMNLAVDTKFRAPTEQLAMVSVVEVPPRDKEHRNRKSSLLIWCEGKWRAVLAELVATAMLLLFGCMACLPLDGFEVLPPIYVPFGFGMVVLINIQIFGHISGAHMNPAVTLSAVIWGSISPGLATAYVVVQCAGAILGYGALYLLAGIDIISASICMNQVNPGINVYQAIMTEICLTSALVLICLAASDSANEHKQDSMALKFGLIVTGLSIVGSSLSGCSMNPARSLGPAVWVGNWSMHYVYWVGPLVGSAISSLIYKYIWATRTSSADLSDSDRI